MERASERTGATTLDTPLVIEVDRVAAAFASWYELFPRSWGGLKEVEKQIPAIAELGFDVLYFPPIHPIGVKARKGRNNTLTAGPDDPGSPYAIGGKEGGHDAVHPELGTMDDVRALCATAREHGMDVALDLALNSSPDHPWLKEHPEWFQQRPDGTLKYAENPPKRYQDIYNFNWDTPAWRELWQAWRDVVVHWVEAGIKFFRVDNPHTKPFPFWEWLIKEVHEVDRRVVFLAEAFTRRAVMRQLAKIGFTQSYTYFTWKNSRWELTRVRQRARPRAGARVLPPQLLHQHAGHPPRLPPARRAGGVRLAARARGHAQPQLRHLLGLRVVRERAGARGLRGVPRLREVRDQAAVARRPAAPDGPPHQRDPPREPRAAAARERLLHRLLQRGPHRLCQVRRRATR